MKSGTDDRLLSSVTQTAPKAGGMTGSKKHPKTIENTLTQKAKIGRSLAVLAAQIFHEISRAEGPGQQTTKVDGLSHPFSPKTTGPTRFAAHPLQRSADRALRNTTSWRSRSQ